MSTDRKVCNCCRGVGIVPDIIGDPRPCSVCQFERFQQWAERRRPCGPIDWGARLARTPDERRP